VPVAIIEATLRDVTFIAANMRQCDRDEVYCQLPAGTSSTELAAYAMQAGAHVAAVDGQPVAAFGAVPRSVCVMDAWLWGTDKTQRVIPAVTRYFARVLMPQWLEQGVRRLEARSISTHTLAHRWMTSTGAVLECALPDCGRDGEGFLQFAWTLSSLEHGGRDALQRFMRGKR
jgi:hypothetical protein